MKTKKYLKTIYLILICTVLPLYMKQGYYMLGEAKGLAFLIISIVLLTPVLLINICKKSWHITLLLGANIFSNIVTVFFSVDKKTAFLGIEGWRTGFLTILIMILACHFFIEGNLFNNYILAALFITPFLSFILGIINRFRIYPFEIYGADSSFVATLGNINWYAGYMSIFLPLGIAIGFSRKWKTPGFIACNVYNLTGLIAIFVVGSESGALIILGTYMILLLLSLGKRESFKAFIIQLSILGTAMECVAILLGIFGNRYNYESSIMIICCEKQIGLIIIALSFFLYRVVSLCEEIKVPWKNVIYRRIIGAAAIVAFLGIIVAWGKGAFEGSFGNGRGIIWSISIDIYRDLYPWQKLFGVGQDCYFTYAYHDSIWADSLLNIFNGNILTNAHCEILTVLIERGIVGVLCYYGMICFVVYRILKDYDTYEDEKKKYTLACVLPIIAYLCNSIVSFSTVISTPYLYVLLGLAMGIIQNSEQE